MNRDRLTHEIPLPGGVLRGCFGCGEDNEAGLRLRFVLEDGRVLCHVRLDPHYQGPPGYAHGGIIATLLDEAMSKANRHRGVLAVTRTLSIDYRRPAPLETDLVLEGWSGPAEGSASGRRQLCRAELRDAAGTILAAGTGTFIAVTDAQMRAAR